MTEINEGAHALSTYGLYTVCAALTAAVVYLFRSLRSLETKFRDYISTNSRELQEKTTTALNDSTAALRESTEALKVSTEALTRIATIIERRHDL